MKKQQLPVLWWLLQRARRVEAICPALINLYAQSVTAKQRFIADACEMLEQEHIVCFSDPIWTKCVPAGERLVFSLEQRRQLSIHALLHEQLFKQRQTVTHASLFLKVPVAHLNCYASQIGQPLPVVDRQRFSPWIPFHLPEPPSREEMAAFVTKHGQGTPETTRYLSNNNLRLLPKIASWFKLIKCFGLEADDLVQEGYFGLLAAGRYFDPLKGAFSTIATRNIYWHMGKAIKLWKHQAGSRKRASIDVESLNNLFGYQWDPFEILGKPGDPEFDDTLALALLVAEQELDNREKKIIRLSFLVDGSNQKSQKEISVELGISKSRVQQIKKEALDKIARRFAKSGITTRHVFG